MQHLPSLRSLFAHSPVLILTVVMAAMGSALMAAAQVKDLSVPAVVAKVRPSVVTILTRGVPVSQSPHTPQSGSGSGIIIDSSGYILTNNHLVEGFKSLVVGLHTGRL